MSLLDEVLDAHGGLARHAEVGEIGARVRSGRCALGRLRVREPLHRSLRHNVWWDDLDTLYFAGYAIWNYLNAPFLLAREGFEVREDGPRSLAVRLPEDVPTHRRVHPRGPGGRPLRFPTLVWIEVEDLDVRVTPR